MLFRSEISTEANGWGARKQREYPQPTLAAPERADWRDWQHPQVGWGMVLPENETLSERERATAIDAPEPLRQLVEQRNHAPVFRYRAYLRNQALRRYAADGKARNVSISGELE